MKYFGTDGFRGKANETLTAHQAFLVGLGFGHELVSKHREGFVYIGKDTRLSSSMLEHALAAGLSSTGLHVKLLGVVPTPLVSYVCAHSEAIGAIMVSASHNPYYDNGIKLFNHLGEKMDEQTELNIEKVIDQEVEVELISTDHIGQIETDTKAVESYLAYLEKNLPLDLSGYKIVLDCANGASVTTAERVFEKLGCEVVVLFNEPNGYNINNHCGSTHPEVLAEKVVELKADAGFAFDGDADRCIGVNHLGELITGDEMLYMIGRHLKEQDKLRNNLVVTTVMANLGLFRALDKLGIETEQTAVGDKYVYEALVNKEGVIGGEQSGHIIFMDLASTGDGVLTALKLSEVLTHHRKSFKDLCEDLIIYPQTLKNIKVNDKKSALENEQLVEKINQVSNQLGQDGRILVRPSGTEPLVRVMVEAKTQELCDTCVDEVIQLIQTLNL